LPNPRKEAKTRKKVPTTNVRNRRAIIKQSLDIESGDRKDLHATCKRLEEERIRKRWAINALSTISTNAFFNFFLVLMSFLCLLVEIGMDVILEGHFKGSPEYIIKKI
jgi:hypothetical protein